MDVEVVAADRDRWSARYPSDGIQAIARWQLKVKPWAGWVPSVLGTSSASSGLDKLDQVLVAIGNRLSLNLEPVAVGEPHGVAAVDHDVRDLSVVDVLLHPAKRE